MMHQQTEAGALGAIHRPLRERLWGAVMRRILAGMIDGTLMIDMPGGREIVIDGGMPTSPARLAIHAWR